MTTRAVQLLTLLAILLGVAFALGYGTAHAQERIAFAELSRQSDSLRTELRNKVALVVRDTFTRDSIVERWHRRRVDTLPGRVDTLPGRVDTVPLLAFADSAIAVLDTLHRRCAVVARECEQSNALQTKRADVAEARVVALEHRIASGSRFRTYERAVCLASLTKNILDWRGKE